MNNTRKQRKTTQPRSLNQTYRNHEPINIQSTCRIGVCGLRLCGNSRGRMASLRAVVLKSFADHVGPKLLLMSGRSDFWPTNVGSMARIACDARVPILFQSETSPKAYVAVSSSGERLPLEIYQTFATSKDTGRKPQLVHELVKQCAKGGERTIYIGGLALGLLICGENNLLANKQSRRNRGYIRFNAALNVFERLRLIFNGAHTKMGNWGKLERRFEFLSAGKRWALYATNNDRKEWGASTLRAYYNGSRIATSEAIERNCDVPAFLDTSDDDRCRILILDIPGSLLL